MQLGLVGLGRMGGNMAERLRAAGHEVIGLSTATRRSRQAASPAELAAALAPPRVVWVMVPAEATDRDIDEARPSAQRWRPRRRRR